MLRRINEKTITRDVHDKFFSILSAYSPKRTENKTFPERSFEIVDACNDLLALIFDKIASTEETDEWRRRLEMVSGLLEVAEWPSLAHLSAALYAKRQDTELMQVIAKILKAN